MTGIMTIYDTMQCISIYYYISIYYNYHNIVILSLLCYKTQSSSVINIIAAVDTFVPACLSLALFLTTDPS